MKIHYQKAQGFSYIHSYLAIYNYENLIQFLKYVIDMVFNYLALILHTQ